MSSNVSSDKLEVHGSTWKYGNLPTRIYTFQIAMISSARHDMFCGRSRSRFWCLQLSISYRQWPNPPQDLKPSKAKQLTQTVPYCTFPNQGVKPQQNAPPKPPQILPATCAAACINSVASRTTGEVAWPESTGTLTSRPHYVTMSLCLCRLCRLDVDLCGLQPCVLTLILATSRSCFPVSRFFWKTSVLSTA